MEKEFFKILSIGEQVEIINDLGGPKKTETVMKALKREKFRFDVRNKLFKIEKYSAKVNIKQITSMDIDEVISRKLTSDRNIDELISEKLTSVLNIEELSNQNLASAINIDELSSQKLISAINLDELSSQKLTDALNLEELSNQKLINAINVNGEAINLISKGISELKEMLNDQKYQALSNSRQKSITNVSQAFNSLPKTIETLERTFKINLEVAENFDDFYEENKGFRVQDLISLALQELIDKYK